MIKKDARPGESRHTERSIIREESLENPWIIEATPQELLETPIDYFFAEHDRQRQAAVILHSLADGERNRKGVIDLIKFLEEDFALHVGDEELALFPLLRVRCAPEDDIEGLIERLANEHKRDESLSDGVLHLLKDLLEGRSVSQEEACKLRAFAEHTRQHLMIENEVLLPIAIMRLDADSLRFLTDMLRQRRRGNWRVASGS